MIHCLGIKNYNVIFMTAIIVIIVYGLFTGQVRPECLHQVCNGV